MNYKDIEKKIVKFIRERTKNFNGAVIGLSGGLDSTVVAYLTVKAIGKDKVYCLLMPYGNQSISDAEEIANLLGIKYKIINIKPIVDTFQRVADFYKDKITSGNLMARIRMCLLYGVANKQKRIVIGTGNKTEIEIGYFTKYGDGGVDIEPIGDLYKTEVKKLAKYLGVPEKIIKKKPSAGLWEGQTDEEEIGIDYNALDSVLMGNKADKKLKKIVEKMKKKTEHKRKMPEIAKVRK